MIGPSVSSIIDSNVAVASTATAYTNSFPLNRGLVFSFWYQFTSPGTVAVGINIELSIDNVTFVTADGDSEIVEAGNKSLHVVNVSPESAKFARIKMIGTGTNNAGTELELGKICIAYD